MTHTAEQLRLIEDAKARGENAVFLGYTEDGMPWYYVIRADW